MSNSNFKANLAVILAQTLEGLCNKYKVDTEISLVTISPVGREDHLVDVSIAAMIKAALEDEPEGQEEEEEDNKATRDELVELVYVLGGVIDQVNDIIGVDMESWGMELNGVTTNLADYTKKFVGRL